MKKRVRITTNDNKEITLYFDHQAFQYYYPHPQSDVEISALIEKICQLYITNFNHGHVLGDYRIPSWLSFVYCPDHPNPPDAKIEIVYSQPGTWGHIHKLKTYPDHLHYPAKKIVIEDSPPDGFCEENLFTNGGVLFNKSIQATEKRVKLAVEQQTNQFRNCILQEPTPPKLPDATVPKKPILINAANFTGNIKILEQRFGLDSAIENKKQEFHTLLDQKLQTLTNTDEHLVNIKKAIAAIREEHLFSNTICAEMFDQFANKQYQQLERYYQTMTTQLVAKVKKNVQAFSKLIAQTPVLLQNHANDSHIIRMDYGNTVAKFTYLKQCMIYSLYQAAGKYLYAVWQEASANHCSEEAILQYRQEKLAHFNEKFGKILTIDDNFNLTSLETAYANLLNLDFTEFTKEINRILTNINTSEYRATAKQIVSQELSALKIKWQEAFPDIIKQDPYKLNFSSIWYGAIRDQTSTITFSQDILNLQAEAEDIMKNKQQPFKESLLKMLSNFSTESLSLRASTDIASTLAEHKIIQQDFVNDLTQKFNDAKTNLDNCKLALLEKQKLLEKISHKDKLLASFRASKKMALAKIKEINDEDLSIVNTLQYCTKHFIPLEQPDKVRVELTEKVQSIPEQLDQLEIDLYDQGLGIANADAEIYKELINYLATFTHGTEEGLEKTFCSLNKNDVSRLREIVNSTTSQLDRMQQICTQAQTFGYDLTYFQTITKLPSECDKILETANKIPNRYQTISQTLNDSEFDLLCQFYQSNKCAMQTCREKLTTLKEQATIYFKANFPLLEHNITRYLNTAVTLVNDLDHTIAANQQKQNTLYLCHILVNCLLTFEYWNIPPKFIFNNKQVTEIAKKGHEHTIYHIPDEIAHLITIVLNKSLEWLKDPEQAEELINQLFANNVIETIIENSISLKKPIANQSRLTLINKVANESNIKAAIDLPSFPNLYPTFVTEAMLKLRIKEKAPSPLIKKINQEKYDSIGKLTLPHSSTSQKARPNHAGSQSSLANREDAKSNQAIPAAKGKSTSFTTFLKHHWWKILLGTSAATLFTIASLITIGVVPIMAHTIATGLSIGIVAGAHLGMSSCACTTGLLSGAVGILITKTLNISQFVQRHWGKILLGSIALASIMAGVLLSGGVGAIPLCALSGGVIVSLKALGLCVSAPVALGLGVTTLITGFSMVGALLGGVSGAILDCIGNYLPLNRKKMPSVNSTADQQETSITSQRVDKIVDPSATNQDSPRALTGKQKRSPSPTHHMTTDHANQSDIDSKRQINGRSPWHSSLVTKESLSEPSPASCVNKKILEEKPENSEPPSMVVNHAATFYHPDQNPKPQSVENFPIELAPHSLT